MNDCIYDTMKSKFWVEGMTKLKFSKKNSHRRGVTTSKKLRERPEKNWEWAGQFLSFLFFHITTWMIFLFFMCLSHIKTLNIYILFYVHYSILTLIQFLLLLHTHNLYLIVLIYIPIATLFFILNILLYILNIIFFFKYLFLSFLFFL